MRGDQLDVTTGGTPGATADVIARAVALGPDLAAASDEIERSRRFPEPLLTTLHSSGIFRILLPKIYGGGQATPSAYLQAVMEVAKHDGSVAWNVFVANSSALITPFLPEASARMIYSGPRDLISWGAPNACAAHAVAGGYRVSGDWDFSSGCRQASWMGAHGPVIEEDGSFRLNEAGKPLLRTFLFPVDQATLHDVWNPIGLRGTASDSYTVDDVFVAEDFSSTREYPDQRQLPGPLYAFTMSGLYAVGVAGVALGLARAMLDEFKSLAAIKAPRGRPRLAEDALTQGEFARMEARLSSAHAYALFVLDDVYARAAANSDQWATIDFEDRAEVRLICTNAIQAGVDVADWTHRAAGVSAIFPGSPFERRFRDIHTVSQQIQSRTAHFQAVGQVLLGEAPAVFY